LRRGRIISSDRSLSFIQSKGEEGKRGKKKKKKKGKGGEKKKGKGIQLASRPKRTLSDRPPPEKEEER